MAKTPAATVKAKAAPKPRAPKAARVKHDGAFEPRADNKSWTAETDAERGLLFATTRRGFFDARQLPDSERTIRPGFLRDLYQGHIAGARVSQHGVWMKGVIFREALDLSAMSSADGEYLPPLSLHESQFIERVDFSNSSFEAIDLEGSTASAGLQFPRLRTTGDLWLDRITCVGQLGLWTAKIGGQLSLKGAALEVGPRPEDRQAGFALRGFGAEVIGGIFCGPSKGRQFTSDGEIMLLDAVIGGVLSLRGCKLQGMRDDDRLITGRTLSLDRAVIKGGVFCQPLEGFHFESHGEIRMPQARIDGPLAMQGARLSGPEELDGKERMTLNVQSATVDGTTFLSEGFQAEGTVTFLGANLTRLLIDGVFRAVEPRLEKVALGLGDSEIRRLQIRIRPDSSGQIILTGANAAAVDGLKPDQWGLPPHEGTGVILRLDGFTYQRAEISRKSGVRRRQWARFRWSDPIAENILELLDRTFHGCKAEANDFRPQPFEQAAKVLREMGHDSAADDIAVAKREFERVCKANDPLSRFLALLHMVFFRYGYGPMRAGLWTVFLLIAGCAAYSFFQSGDGGMLVAGSTPWPQACSQPPLALALDAFLPLVDLHVEDKCRWGETYRWRGWAEGFRIVYSLIGLVFIPMVTLTFAGVLRKD